MIDDAWVNRLIDTREGEWSDKEGDHPTKFGMSLPLWRRYCINTNQTWRGTLGALRETTRADALPFYRWYFADLGIDKMDVPLELFEHVLDLFVLHSKVPGVETIMSEAKEIHERHSMHDAIALARIGYMAEVAEDNPKKRQFLRGWVMRALRMAGRWPRTKTTEV